MINIFKKDNINNLFKINKKTLIFITKNRIY